MKLPKKPTLKELEAFVEFVSHKVEKPIGEMNIKGVGTVEYDSVEHEEALLQYAELYEKAVIAGDIIKTAPGHLPTCGNPDKFEYVNALLSIAFKIFQNNML